MVKFSPIVPVPIGCPSRWKRLNEVKREEYHGTIRPAVKSAVALSIAVNASLAHERFEDAFLRHAAPRNIDRGYNPNR